MRRNLFSLQILFVLGGTIVAWTAVLRQMKDFYGLYGTFFRFNDCAIPNPFATACLYGAVAFLIALIWSVRIAVNPSLRSERYLRNFLAFGVVFALSVLAYEFLAYYKVFSFSGQVVSCSPGEYPLRTPCFYGMLFFLGGFITAWFLTKRLKVSMVN